MKNCFKTKNICILAQKKTINISYDSIIKYNDSIEYYVKLAEKSVIVTDFLK